MRKPHATGLLAICAVLLAGCSSPTAAPSSTVGAETSPTLEKSALTAKARGVYLHYLDSVQKVSENNNSGYEVLEQYLTKKAYESEVNSFRSLKAAGLHTTGATKLVKFVPQSVASDGERLTAYACVDLTAVKVIDEKGDDVTPRTRPNRQTSLPTFVMRNGVMQLEVNGTWSGDSIC